MPHHTVTLASNKGTGAIAWGFVSAQWTQFLLFKLPFKTKCVSSVTSMRSAQLLSAYYRVRNSFANSIRSCESPNCNIWTRLYRYGNTRSTECSSFGNVVFDISNTRPVPHAICMCPEVTVWCTSVTNLWNNWPSRSWFITGAARIFEFFY